MASLNMRGPYKIWIKDETGKQVKNTGNIVSKNVKYGNYAFGIINKNNKFCPSYVGRSDFGLLTEINQQIDKGKADGCTHFKYSTADSPTEAYEKECQNYHDFKPKYNKEHPDKPKDNGHYSCPVEGCEYHASSKPKTSKYDFGC